MGAQACGYGGATHPSAGQSRGPSRLFRAGESRRAWHSAMLHSAQEGGCISSGIAQALLINSGSPAPAS